MKIIPTVASLAGCLLWSGCILETDLPDPVIHAEQDNAREDPGPLPEAEARIREVLASEVLKNPPEPHSFEYHEVQPGETISLIANRFGTTAEKIVQVNGLGHPEQLPVGQRLYLPKVIR